MNNKINKSFFKKIFHCIIASVIPSLLISGCGASSSSQSSSSSVNILYSICDNDDTFRSSLSDAIMSAASSNGVTVDMQLCGSDVADQLEQISTAKSKGYDAIIVRLTDVSTALQIEVAANGLPLIFVNNQPDDDRLSDNEFVYVGSDEEEAGQYQAEYVIKKLGNPSSMNVIIMEGEKGHSGTIGRTSAVKNTLKDNGVNANYVFVDYANWTSDGAYDMMTIFEKTGQSVDAVFCNNDTMAIGVADYLIDNGATSANIIPITGVDATSDACAYIKEGKMSFTVLQDAATQGTCAVLAAKALGSGGTISSIDGATSDGKYIWVPYVPVDSSNVNNYL